MLYPEAYPLSCIVPGPLWRAYNGNILFYCMLKANSSKHILLYMLVSSFNVYYVLYMFDIYFSVNYLALRFFIISSKQLRY